MKITSPASTQNNLTLDNFLWRENPRDTGMGRGSRSLNIDLTNKCTLECITCERGYRIFEYGKVPGGNITVEDFKKYFELIDHFAFCGQVSDPSMHPQLKEIVKLVIENNKSCSIHNTASQRPEKWYREMFEECSHEMVEWYFGIDGLPKDSHKYRTRQDGEKLYRMMELATKYMDPANIIWKYIVFNYNQTDLLRCKQMARDLGIIFYTVVSDRHPPGLKPDDLYTGNLAMTNAFHYPDGHIYETRMPYEDREIYLWEWSS